MGRAVGIDLGTTNSVVAVMEAGQPLVLTNAEGGRTTPSVVAFGADGLPLVGEVAKRQAVTNTERTVRSVKRHVGSDWQVLIDSVPYAPSQVLALVLAKLKRDAESYLGEDVTDAVITVPAYFTDAQRQAVKDAGTISGLEVQRIINEPTAAALAYGSHLAAGETTLVFDLGGGTFDVSLLTVDKDDDGFTTVQVVATSGDNHLGGDDWDAALVELLCDRFDAANGTDVRADPVARQRMLEAAEAAKVTLSASPSADVSLPYLVMGPAGAMHLSETLTRADFESATAALLDRCRGPLEQVLADSGVAVNEIGHVVLVGGSTRMPAVADLVREVTGQEPFKGVNPDEVVAAGAAMQAGVLSGERDDVLLIDVTPFNLGIETRGGGVAVLIDANTAIPVRRARVFTTSTDNQETVKIRVLQGSHPHAIENTLLGNFALTPIPAAAKGTPQIEVAFDIDANGIVSVSATDLATGTAQSMVVSGTGALSDEEVAAAAKEAERFAELEAEHRARVDAQNEAASAARHVRDFLAEHEDAIARKDAKMVQAHLELLDELLASGAADAATLRTVTVQMSKAARSATEQMNPDAPSLHHDDSPVAHEETSEPTT